MNKFEKIQLKDIFKTIIQIADDCLYELDNDDCENNEDEIITLLEIKTSRINNELNSFEKIVS